MIIFLLVPLLVTAEWVEITQNYRKDYKPTRYDHTTSKNYNNQSIVEHQWSRGHVHRINNPTIKRIQINGRKTSENTEKNDYQEDITTKKTIRSPQTDPVILHQASKINQRVRNQSVYKNKHESVTKLERKTIITKTRSDSNNENNKQTVQNPLKVSKNNLEDIIDNRNENVSDIVTPCPDTTTVNSDDRKDKNTGNLQNHTHDDKIKTKTNVMETLVKFLKVVSQTIKHGTRKTFTSKIRYLEDLRDGLMANIESRIESAFPDDKDEGRRRRAARAESRGHVEFPSSESALMTISFLTFAVFLIKLVLQVIHTYKAKTMMMTPAVIATVGRAVFKKSTPN